MCSAAVVAAENTILKSPRSRFLAPPGMTVRRGWHCSSLLVLICRQKVLAQARARSPVKSSGLAPVRKKEYVSTFEKYADRPERVRHRWAVAHDHRRLERLVESCARKTLALDHRPDHHGDHREG